VVDSAKAKSSSHDEASGGTPITFRRKLHTISRFLLVPQGGRMAINPFEVLCDDEAAA
jgi:hypothetical protein